MGLRDVEEQLDACRADTIALERERDAAIARVEHLEDRLEAMDDRAFPAVGDGCCCSRIADLKDAWGAHVEALLGYDAACPVHSRHLYNPRIGAWVLRDGGPGVVLTVTECVVIAPFLLEAGVRYREHPGTAWQQVGEQVHAITERLYNAIQQPETTNG